ncbi:MAG: hypothetical protein R3C03_08845 [Pirellulaceae bacterium]
MPISFRCPGCGKQFENVKKKYLGKRIQCFCGKVLRLGQRESDSSAMSIAGLVIDSGDSLEIEESLHDSLQIVEKRSASPRAVPQTKQPDNANDAWMTKQIDLDEGKRQSSRSKSHHQVIDSNAETVHQVNISEQKTGTGSIIQADDLSVQMQNVPSVSYQQIPTISPSMSTMAATAERAPMDYAFAASHNAVSKRQSTNSILNVILCSGALLECAILLIISFVMMIRYGSTALHWMSQGVDTSLYAHAGLRVLIGGLLGFGSLAFAFFALKGIMAFGEASRGRGQPNNAFSNAGVAGAFFIFVLMMCGAVLLYTTLATDQSKDQFVDDYWPSSVVEVFAITILAAFIPALVFFAGFIGIFDPAKKQKRY